MFNKSSSLFMVLCLGAALALSGCAAGMTYLENKDLVVQTRMSETIFLEPVSPEKKTVWLDVKNTSDQDFDLSSLRAYIEQRGYKVVSDPNAFYRYQVSILFVGECDETALSFPFYDACEFADRIGETLAGCCAHEKELDLLAQSQSNLKRKNR